MRLLAVFLAFFALILSSCKKEESNVSAECRNPVVYQKFESAQKLVLAAMDARLADFSNTGYCDTCYNTQLLQANADIYSVGELYSQESSCYNVLLSYQGQSYKMIQGAQIVPEYRDSAEYAALRQQYSVKFGQILRYLESLQ
jgi:hypothetical protein